MSLTDATHGATPEARPHGLVAKLLHWGTAGLLLFAFIDNGDVTGALRDPAAMRFEAWVGLAVLATFALRWVWMRWMNGGASRLPASAPAWERWASRVAHNSLYLCVGLIVLTGLSIPLAQAVGGRGLVGAAADLHEFVAGLTLWVIAAHVAAALWHKLVRRDGMWEAIGTPWWSRPRLPDAWAGRAQGLAERLAPLPRRLARRWRRGTVA